MTDNIIKSIETYLKSISNLKTLVYEDSSLDITQTFNISPQLDVGTGVNPSFIMLDNEDGVPLISDTADYFLNWYFKYTGGTDDEYLQIIAYNNITGEVTIEGNFSAGLLTTDTLNLFVLDALFIDSGSEYQSYMKMNATEETLPIFLRLQTKEDSDKKRIRNNAYSIKLDLIKKKKRLPIYEDGIVSGGICGYMKILSSFRIDPRQDDDKQIQIALMSFTVNYTMNYTK